MSPKRIIEKCLEKKLDIIGICDHNSAENTEAVISAGKLKGIHVIPGMEICSKEEVHMLSFFETAKEALLMQEFIYDNLPGKTAPPYSDIRSLQMKMTRSQENRKGNNKLFHGRTDNG